MPRSRKTRPLDHVPAFTTTSSRVRTPDEGERRRSGKRTTQEQERAESLQQQDGLRRGDRPAYGQPDECVRTVRCGRLRLADILWRTKGDKSSYRKPVRFHKDRRQREYWVPVLQVHPGHWQHWLLHRQRARQRRYTNKAFFGS